MFNLAELEARLAGAKAFRDDLEQRQCVDMANAQETVLILEREVNAEREHQRGLAERRLLIAEREREMGETT